ncbi:SecA wing/scaffold domain protein [Dictyocaulus viviparus]|uniref:SecA wing/scaffold domain protein n=1 Tax=Dictyocaulus viviparus TaxID=29172 RepID=A0A0D8XEM8_DICVI|nr:SecA wing/scaffold domain protein [Dictyocaulus viviparus]
MAGRGTDIKLGEGVAEIGGLYVIGTERHEARRIDMQLRGRSGGQGDPGMSRFFISFADPLLKRFAQERIQKAANKLKDDYFDSRFFSRMLQGTQKKIEPINFDIRKNLIDYDHVLTNQREMIYKQRDHVLQANKFDNIIQRMLINCLSDIFLKASNEAIFSLSTMKKLTGQIATTFAITLDIDEEKIKDMGYNEFYNYILEISRSKLNVKLSNFPVPILGNLLREILIRNIDHF